MFLNPFLTPHGGLLFLIICCLFAYHRRLTTVWSAPGPKCKRSRREVRGW